MMATLEWQWVINQGMAVALVVFIGFVLWRVLVGTEKTGYQGLLIKWASGLANSMGQHFIDEKERGKEQSVQHCATMSALHLLVESQDTPVGAAFIAAKAVHKTAENVVQLRAAMLQATKMCRLVAAKFPELEQDIDRHCDEIERIIGEA